MTYRLVPNNYSDTPSIFRVDDAMWIPTDPANTDYQEYLAWVEEGNVAEEWVGEE